LELTPAGSRKCCPRANDGVHTDVTRRTEPAASPSARERAEGAAVSPLV